MCLVMLQHKSLLLRPTKCQGPALAPPLLLSPWVHLYTAGGLEEVHNVDGNRAGPRSSNPSRQRRAPQP